MLEGTYAFEKRWSELRERFPTTPAQDALIVRAINNLSSNHRAVNDITETLPKDLRALFRELAQAYLKAQRDAAHKAEEAVAFETLVIDQPSTLRSAPKSKQPNDSKKESQPLPEVATFIVDQPTSLGTTPGSIEQPTVQQAPVELARVAAKSPLKPSQNQPHVSLEQQLQAIAEKRKYSNLSNSSKSKSSVENQYKKSEPVRVNMITPPREEMATILPSDRPKITESTAKPGIFQRLLNWLSGRT
jgi:hypothetical protein